MLQKLLEYKREVISCTVKKTKSKLEFLNGYKKMAKSSTIFSI